MNTGCGDVQANLIIARSTGQPNEYDLKYVEYLARFVANEHADAGKFLVEITRLLPNCPEIVVDLSFGELALGEGDVKIVVEVAAEGRNPLLSGLAGMHSGFHIISSDCLKCRRFQLRLVTLQT